MILKSYSKINLTLRVNKKLKHKKLHDIQSYYCLIDLHDEINIKATNEAKDKIKFHGKFAKNVNNSKNSIKSTLSILRKRNLVNNYFSILIKKNIPVFGGLGGGTSNSAFLTKYLVKNNMTKSISDTLSKRIGSDFRLFSHNQGFIQNLSKNIKLKKKHNLYFALVYPNIRSSTKLVYSKVKKYSPKSSTRNININKKSMFIKFLAKSNNDLQKIVEINYPKIKRLIEEMGQFEGCCFSRLTGSGSVCYGVFKSRKLAKNALTKIKLKYPKYWSSFAKTI